MVTTTQPTTTTAPPREALDFIEVGEFGGAQNDNGTYNGAVSISNISDEWIAVAGLDLDVLADGAVIEVVTLNFDFLGEPLYLAPGANWFAIELFDPAAIPDEIQGRAGDTSFTSPPGEFEITDLAIDTSGFADTVTGRVDSTWPTDLELVSVHVVFLDDGAPVFGLRGFLDRLPAGGAAFLDVTSFSVDLDPSWEVEVTILTS